MGSSWGRPAAGKSWTLPYGLPDWTTSSGGLDSGAGTGGHGLARSKESEDDCDYTTFRPLVHLLGGGRQLGVDDFLA